MALSSHARIPAQAQLLHADPDYALATWQAVFVLWWRHDTTASAVEHLHTQLGQFCHLHQTPVVLTIVSEGAPLPAADIRERLAAVLRDNRKLVASAVVFEGTGFRAAAVRSVVAGLGLIARQPFPHRIFASVSVAAQWLMATHGSMMPSHAPILVGAIDQLRTDIRTGTRIQSAS